MSQASAQSRSSTESTNGDTISGGGFSLATVAFALIAFAAGWALYSILKPKGKK